MNGGPTKFTLKSGFTRATGDRYWHTNFVLPSTKRIAEYEWTIRLDGANTARFDPYALKVGLFGDRQNISFDIRDNGECPLEGDGSNAEMILDVYLA